MCRIIGTNQPRYAYWQISREKRPGCTASLFSDRRLKSNDRIPYAYIDKGKTKQIIGYKKIKERRQVGEFKNGKPKYKNFMVDDLTQPKYKKITILQGDRIEHIDYIKENKMDLDYEFYISNQIMNPVKQVLDLELDKEETEKIFSKVDV